ncbi:MAG: hypothetical protein ACXWRE_01300 [Pseudobdellovibrionaceae bacterium]
MKYSAIEEYWKHTALNIGQATRDIRYFYYHPEADRIAAEGTIRHYAYSSFQRIRSFGNNIFFSIIPPHWHHTKQDLEYMTPASAKEWFLHGYAPWEYPDPIKKRKNEAKGSVK